MAAVVETLEEKKHEKETTEKEAAEGMDVDKQDEEVKEKVGKKVEDGGVGKEEEAKSDDAISPKTPGSRPTRERKTVERYFESVVARGSATKPLSIEKGQGTQLKDIPNVAYKLSKRKPDDNLQMLHSILFGKKTKAHNLKKNIGLFSGYVWVENEEKQRAKIKERLDKCVKEKLLFFCDILNIPVSRSAAKKDELSVKLLEFLESPHSTTDSLLVEKEQKSKKRKSKGKTSKKTGSLDQSAGKSAKKLQKAEGEKRKRSPKIEGDESDDEPSSARDESGDDNDDEEANEVGSDHEESGSEKEEDEEQEEEKPKKKKSNGTVSSKKDSGNKVTEKAKAVKKDNPAKSPKSSSKSTKVSASKRDASDADSLVTPKKQKVEKKSQKEENESVKENASNKKKSSKSIAKVSEKEGKEKSGKKAKAEPSNEEIHSAVVNILKEVDFNSATLSDIIRNLGSHFGVDLMHRKAEVKAIITDVINNMSDEEEGDDAEAENEEDDAENDEEKNEGDDAEAENDEEKNEEDDAENDEEKNEGDDVEAENDDEKNEGDGPDAENDDEKNEGGDSDA